MCVADSELRVRGLERLRVIDTSGDASGHINQH
jgi:choline dehydrogenase-like flavoprotein